MFCILAISHSLLCRYTRFLGVYAFYYMILQNDNKIVVLDHVIVVHTPGLTYIFDSD